MSRRQWVLGVAALALLGLLAPLVLVEAQRRGDADLEELLVTDLEPPSTVREDQWRVVVEFGEITHWAAPRRNNRYRSWSDDPESAGIVRQDVVKYRTVTGARHGAHSEWRGYLNHHDFSHALPSEPYRSELADEQHMLCMLHSGIVSECDQWFFLARYGQYTLNFSYRYATLGQDEFKHMLSQVERHLVELIG
jgi:hypothetical protein